MFPDPDGFGRLHSARRTLFRRPFGFNLRDVTAIQVGLVFEEANELSPRRILLVAGVVRLFEHPLHVQVLDEHGVVFTDEPRRDLVLVVQHLPLDVVFHLRHFPTLLLVVVRPLLLARQLALLALESFVLVFKLKPVHGLAIRSVDVVENTEVDSNAVARVKRVHVGLLGQASVVSFEAEGDKPPAGRLLFDCDLFDVRFVRDVAVIADFDVPDLGEPECRVSATRIFEFEARLRKRHTLKLPWRLPLELPDLPTVLFLLGESVEVLVEPCDGSLQSLRIDF